MNLFLPGSPAPDPAAVAAYRDRLAPARRPPRRRARDSRRWDDDQVAAKLDLVAGVPVVSLTFGCPSQEQVAALQGAGSAVLVTVTSVDEARQALQAGPDGLWLQGAEAGAHRGSFADDGEPGVPLRRLLADVRAETDLPLVAAGGLMDARRRGDRARRRGHLGRPRHRVPRLSGGGHPPDPPGGADRSALRPDGDDPGLHRTVGARPGQHLRPRARRAAPRGYPEVHHVTRPLRTAAAAAGDPEHLHLWAGEGWRRLRQLPAYDLVRSLAVAQSE